ncbi:MULTISPECIES: alpha/beta fold hydrolase [Flavobacterium]|uniref:Alpha/beta hydrolase n=2 Tax=Flavobacterium TaxID=237 RepID=A0AA94EX96_9FLAO|nr:MULTISPECIES: alpha/beta hydrolase [Flavobacterium]OXA83344.1 alpha/beta hydrolase [Flavobacterium columnare] [Flavobacterium columnare NBRC 100251 = ATCC 23463]AMA50470.1 alpha/beta hydrolase [Flavobacterium covae]AND64008.1 alpha/beta hydrolase [Flavobacterium covae]MCH4829518.1 alpha/beta hydrolase [Flavobacterium columnare]MCH4831485.1 alpha/beta hydrolase [Flavobacterium columnare]
MNFITYKNTKIAYSIQGNGSTIVLLHGFLENSSMWDFYKDEFSKEYQVVCIDLLGHGKTECIGYIHTMEDMAEVVFAILSSLSIKKATFVGHSMGGYVSLAFAEKYAEMTSGLVLLNATAYADDHERKINRNRAIKMAQKEYNSLIQISVANLFSTENREQLSNEINQVKLEALKTPLQGYIACQEGMKARKNRVKILQTAFYPTLLILGKKDGILNYDESIKQLENTSTELVTLPDGHMSHIENKGVLGSILIDFFKKC